MNTPQFNAGHLKQILKNKEKLTIDQIADRFRAMVSEPVDEEKLLREIKRVIEFLWSVGQVREYFLPKKLAKIDDTQKINWGDRYSVYELV